MNVIATTLLYFSGVSFLIYGVSCLVSRNMSKEFARFGLSRFRVLVGVLEVVAGLAQLAYVFAPMLARLATGGIFLLMILGVITRIRVKDSLWVTAPALAYAALNGWLLSLFMQP